MNKRWFYPTNEGFPQGSPISPSLANLALNNLQESIGKEFLSTRYADDFIVLGKNKKELEEIALPRIKKFLEVRGLKLSLEKTYITDISKGFDFLGYNFREYPDKNRIKGIKQGIFLVKPSHKKVKDFKRDLSLTVRKYRKASMYLLIQTLNQKLRGWSEHYRTVTSQKMFSSISYHLWQICWKMLRKRHRRRPAKYLIKKYFTKVDGNK
jgi:RNA-directed DNA polymerase